MAVSVDTVYRTVLLILNKEQRGYITPDEFNKIAAQVQIEIFNEYFDDLNKLLRIQQSDLDYANKVTLIDEKIAIFKTNGNATGGTLGIFSLPTSPGVRELGTVIYNEIEIQRLQRSDFYNINKSDLTRPSNNYPIYLYEDNKIKVYPITITSGVSVNYIRNIIDPIWGFTVGTRGQYLYNANTYSPGNPFAVPLVPATGSRNFELHQSEQTRLIIKILVYAGIIIKDPQIVQAAAQQVETEQINSKS